MISIEIPMAESMKCLKIEPMADNSIHTSVVHVPGISIAALERGLCCCHHPKNFLGRIFKEILTLKKRRREDREMVHEKVY